MNKKIFSSFFIMLLSMGILVLSVSAEEGDVPIDEKNFPDQTFRNYISAAFDQNKDNVLDVTEIHEITEIDLHSDGNPIGVTDLTGLSHFDNLRKLNCSGNAVGSIDLSSCTKLSELYCNQAGLTELNLTNNGMLNYLKCSNNNLSSLDLSSCSRLYQLDCSGNQLTELDLSKTDLYELDCSSNHLTTLDTSTLKRAFNKLLCSDNELTSLRFGNLLELDCSNNQLTAIDTSFLTDTERISCANNKIKKLDLLRCVSLRELNCAHNQLEELILPQFAQITDSSYVTNLQLERLNCEFNQLTELDLHEFLFLGSVSCHNNKIELLYLPTRNTSLELTAFPQHQRGWNLRMVMPPARSNSGTQSNEYRFKRLNYYNEEMTPPALEPIGINDLHMENDSSQLIGGSDQSIAFGLWENETYAAFRVQRPNAEENFYFHLMMEGTEPPMMISPSVYPDTNFRRYILQDLDPTPDGIITQEQIDSVTTIEIILDDNNYEPIMTMKGIETFRNLKVLNSYADVHEVDVSQNLQLEYFSVTQSSLSGTLDLSNLKNLQTVECYNNDLSGINVKGLSKLKKLSITRNKITSLDVSSNPSLEELNIGYNNITELDLTLLPNLKNLIINGLSLLKLDLSLLPNLEGFYCSECGLKELDLSGNPKLKELNCSENPLGTLDISGNPNITQLNCNDCALTSLNVTAHPFLTNLECIKNQISSLDLTHNTALEYLWCNENNLTSLDLRNCTRLERCYCGDNMLTTLYLPMGQESINDIGFRMSFLPQKNDAVTDVFIPNRSYSYTKFEFAKIYRFPGYGFYDVDALSFSLDELKTNASEGTFTQSGLPQEEIRFTFAEGVSEASVTWKKNYKNEDYTGTFRIKYNGKESVAINKDTFPDDNFRAFVAENFDQDKDGKLSPEELEQITEIELYPNYQSVNVTDLTGLSYFYNLRWFSCDKNAVGKLDVSCFPFLEKLYCCGCGLTELDVSANTRLTMLTCFDNQITSLDLSNCPLLTRLYCSNNKLTSLNISSCTELEILKCQKNQLTALKLDNFKKLTELHCGDNQIKTLDASSSPNLKIVSCENNKLTELNLTGPGIINQLYCQNNLLTELHLKEMSKGLDHSEITITCYGNHLDILELPVNVKPTLIAFPQKTPGANIQMTIPTPLEGSVDDPNTYYFSNFYYHYDGGENENSIDFPLSSKDLICGETGFIEGNLSDSGSYPLEPGIKSGTYAGFQIIPEEQTEDNPNPRERCYFVIFREGTEPPFRLNPVRFPDFQFRRYLLDTLDSDHDSIVSQETLDSVTKIYIPNSSDNYYPINTMQGIEYFQNLLILDTFTNVHYVDVSKNLKLEVFKVYQSRLEGTLDLSMLKNLHTIRCDRNYLTGLNVTGLTNLKMLDCSNNPLKSIDVSTNINLEELLVANTAITELNLSNNKHLKILNISSTSLNSFDMSFLTELENFSCANCHLTELNLSSHPKLTKLFCARNPLRTMDFLSALPNLKELVCEETEIDHLDVSMLPYLEVLKCDFNSIDNLILGTSTALRILSCTDNNLRMLDLRPYTNLRSIHCGNNPLELLYLPPEREDLNLNEEYFTLCFLPQTTDIPTAVCIPAPADSHMCTEMSYTTLYQSGSGFTAKDIYRLNSDNFTVDPMEGRLYHDNDNYKRDNLRFTFAEGVNQATVSWDTGEYKGTFLMVKEGFEPEINHDGELAINEDNFPDINFRNFLKTLPGGSDLFFSEKELAAIKGMNCSGREIKDLTGIGYFTALETLDCTSNAIETLDVSMLSNLKHLNCSLQSFHEENTPVYTLKNVKIAGLSKLESFECRKAPLLASLDCTGLSSLQVLTVDQTGLTSIDLTDCLMLTDLTLTANKLTELQISNLQNLERLDVSNNQLTALALPKTNQLSLLNIQYNELTSLDLTGLPMLTDVSCGNNHLKSIVWDSKTNLHRLRCINNELEKLDLSVMTNLEELYCSSNLLTSLQLPKTSSFQKLECDDNRLELLDLSGNQNLSWIHCDDNFLTTLDLRDITQITRFLPGFGHQNLTILLSERGIPVSALRYRAKVYYDPEEITEADLENLTGGVIQNGVLLFAEGSDTITFTFKGFTATLTTKNLVMVGDVNGDGHVDIGDHQRLYEHLNGSNKLSAECLAAADVNGDGHVDIGDHQRLYEHLNGTNPL